LRGRLGFVAPFVFGSGRPRPCVCQKPRKGSWADQDCLVMVEVMFIDTKVQGGGRCQRRVLPNTDSALNVGIVIVETHVTTLHHRH
jgi:hypothetical protein